MEIVREVFLVLLLVAVASAVIMPFLINFLYRLKIQASHQLVNSDGQTNQLFIDIHGKKTGTPQGGGILWFLVFPVSVLLISGINDLTLILSISTVLIGLLGFTDDFKKLLNIKFDFKSDSLLRKGKFIYQWVVAFGIGFFVTDHFPVETIFSGFPVLEDLLESYNFLFIPIFAFILVSYINAFNINDGLDGLMAGQAIWIFTGMMFLTLMQGRYEFAEYFAVMIGCLVPFLYFNVHPARVFMGDIGSTALGIISVLLALLSNNLLPFFIMTLPSILEVTSSFIQIFSYKLFKKRVFKIAPFHHHLEAGGWPAHLDENNKGWPETKITQRFWIAQMMCVFLAFFVAFL
jgi:phospho-N-acetylmuramoyl-pentapeptide-transferase